MSAPNPYCESLPTQLRAWDATALRRFMECPYKYWLMQVQGWRKKGNIDIEFGKAYHTYAEMFDKLRLDGVTQEDAARRTISSAARNQELWTALETSYLPGWRCSSPKEVTNSKGKVVRNVKRCPLAKALQLEGGHRNGYPCPECELPTVDDWEMLAPNKNKNRDTLLRTILFYCDTADDRVVPYKFPDGTPAVELSFKVPLPLQTPDGEPYLLTGNMDGMVECMDEVIPRERKTTKSTPGGYFFNRYAPDTQIDTYDLAAWLMFSDVLPTKPHGVMVEVTQVTQSFTRIERQLIMVPEERRAEWLQDVQVWIKMAEDCARSGVYPKNTSACGANGGCPMRDICRMAPSSRPLFLPGERYEKNSWNPMEIR